MHKKSSGRNQTPSPTVILRKLDILKTGRWAFHATYRFRAKLELRKRKKKGGGGGNDTQDAFLEEGVLSTLTPIPTCYLVEARGGSPWGSGGVGGDALVHCRSCLSWHCRLQIVPNPFPGVLFWSDGVVVVKIYRNPVRCNGGKNAHTYPGLGAGPFDGHNASLGQERAIDDQEEPLKYYDNVKS